MAFAYFIAKDFDKGCETAKYLYMAVSNVLSSVVAIKTGCRRVVELLKIWTIRCGLYIVKYFLVIKEY